MADRLELAARLQLRQGAFAQANGAAMQAANIRQEGLDYRGMARALSVAALAAERAEDREPPPISIFAPAAVPLRKPMPARRGRGPSARSS